MTEKAPHQAVVPLLHRSADGVSFDSVKNALRVPVLSLRYERYSLCAPRGIVSALQRYTASDIITQAEIIKSLTLFIVFIIYLKFVAKIRFFSK